MSSVYQFISAVSQTRDLRLSWAEAWPDGQCTMYSQAAITRNISYSYLVSTQASDWSTLVRDVRLPT